MQKSRFVSGLIGAVALVSLTQCFTQKKNEGERLYAEHCQSCHLEDGKGLRGVIPPIAGADYLENHRNELPCLIRHGIEGSITVNGVEYNQKMPGVETMPEDDITNLLNYIQTNFGNQNRRYTLNEVQDLLNLCPPHQH
ncbi:c-type cytochrome [Pontibacter arcticus]|uniref:Cytochrome c n=1 Tax=Pontibacter arcticus TaxID=2080288 RepID=A0A364REH8_9BACT|nr:cytochrome c [Pontibacter arcticus]RAU82682.1 cytochrome c [Pontibacter arcticus]